MARASLFQGKMKDSKKQKLTILMAMITAFITSFTGSAVNLSVPNIGLEFGASAALVGWIITGYTVSTAALSIPMGKVADRTGRRRLLIIGVISFSAISLACAFAWNIWALIVLRIIQGMAASMIFATNNPILISAFPANQRGRVLGISTAATYTGLSLGPVIGGLINGSFGWRAIFFVTFVVSMVSLYLIFAGVEKEKIRPSDKAWDVRGAMVLIAGVALFLYGLTGLSTIRFGWAILLAGVLLGIVFVLVERKTEDPVVPLTLFTKDRVYVLSNIAALLNYGATFAISYLISIYLQVVMGYSSEHAGLILIAMPAVQAVFSPVMGRLSDRIQPYKLASLGMGFCMLGVVLFSFIGTDTHLAYVIAALVIEGFGFAVFSSPNTNEVMSRVDRKDYSIANSILSTMRNSGHSSSMAVVTIIVGLTMGSRQLAEAEPEVLIGTMHTVFHVFIVVLAAGIVISLMRGGHKGGK